MSPASYRTAPPRAPMVAGRVEPIPRAQPDGDTLGVGDGDGEGEAESCSAWFTKAMPASISFWYVARSPFLSAASAALKCCWAWASSWPTWPVGGGPPPWTGGGCVGWPNDAAMASDSEVAMVAFPPC